MPKAIWKFQFRRTTDREAFEVPKDSELLSVKKQNEAICLWFLVDPTKVKEMRYFELFITGNDSKWENEVADRVFLDTVLTHRDQLVIHVFERKG